MRTKKRILKGVFACNIWLLCVFGFLLRANADEYNADKALESMVVVEIYYQIGDETEIFIQETQGILVGTTEKGAGHVIVNAEDVFAMESLKNSFIEQNAFSEEQKKKLQFVTDVSVGKDIYIGASVENYSEELNFAILKLEKSVFDKPALIFNLDEDAVQFSEDIYVIDKISSTANKGVMLAEIQREGTTYLEYKADAVKNHHAAMVVNDMGEFMGFSQLSNGTDTFLALSAKEVALILKTLGIEFCVADHTDYSVNDTALQTAIVMAERMEVEGYTQDSVLSLQAVIEEGKAVLNNEAHTQEEVDAACEKLIQVQDELVVEEKLDPVALVAIIVAAVLFLAIIVIIIVLICIKKKRQRIQRENEELERKKAPTNQGPYMPAMHNKKSSLLASGSYYETGEPGGAAINNNNVSTKLNQLKGFAPSSSAIVLNEEDTTVLSEEVLQNKQFQTVTRYMNLVNEKNGKKYTVNKDYYIIGKSVQNADLVLENKSVSREHAKIITHGNQFCLSDTKSLNGTFLNGIRLSAGEEHQVENGDIIKFSDEIFRVEIEK